MMALYARKEPPISLGAQTLPPSKAQRDVRVYRDAGCTEQIGLHPWYYTSKPTRRNRYIMHNCNQYPLIWID